VFELIKKTDIMKQITTILLAIVSLGFIQVAQGQQSISYAHAPSHFIGKWEAKQGQLTFELIISEYKWHPFEDDLFVDMLVGELIYKNDKKTVRQTTGADFNAMFRISGGDILDVDSAGFTIYDRERKVEGYGEFIINKNDPLKAKWELRKGTKQPRDHDWSGLRRDWNKQDFDIPTNLQWRKVE
jgi:hypothetical protein